MVLIVVFFSYVCVLLDCGFVVCGVVVSAVVCYWVLACVFC